ncbi:hypothetical protein GCM10007103_10450 [Salinimicrobium marinum]|uniref:4'-phosphopantetheinyl transferase domain-containing protein n=1 Tax=Salinimicrobium marinum TaxID=680283 RepID=A0A918S9T8_9FLAO|nr:4'-phosphopantetheinyl transferase superfamily protein [Salinimicrobium marinum]GHA30828.1 hypothetical protein GCM10007103_10450 [Salinimicrobium marinum]
MIGNDVVDLDLAATQSNWKRKGFLKKVFTTTEKDWILSSEDKDLAVWLLWSMKEAAYKAHQRKYNLRRQLKWLRQECRVSQMNENSASGVVKIEREFYVTQSHIFSGAVFTSAIKDTKIPVKNSLFQSSSEEMKQSFFIEFSHLHHLPKESLTIQKDDKGIPFIYHERTLHPGVFSFTGHGKYSAFSIALMNC